MNQRAVISADRQQASLVKNAFRKETAKDENLTVEQPEIQSSYDISRLPVMQMRTAYIQPKLRINKPGDKFEQEADRIAEQVMRTSETTVQRQCKACESEEETIQRKPVSITALPEIQRKCANCEEEEEDELQMKSKGNSPAEASASLTSDIHQTKGSGRPLDKSTRQFISAHLGRDLQDVRIHTGNKAARMNQEINARAFTVGRNIYFNQGQYSPGTSAGKRLLAHEMTHVLQQSGGQTAIQREPREVDIPHEGGTCTAKREYKVKEKSKPVDAEFDIDTKNITLSINWCKGRNKGDITIGADVPAQAGEVAKEIFTIVRKGGSSSDVADKLKNTDLTPFVDVVIKQGGKFGISAHGEITTNASGVSGGKGSLVIDTGPVKIKPTIEKNKDTGTTGTLNLEFEFGRKPEKVECPTTTVTIGQELSCECTVPAYDKPGTKQVPYTDETKYFYFKYDSSEFSPARIEQSRSEIMALLKAGYQVKQIHGFASPEGTSDKSAGFEGNETLAGQRATAARVEIERLCKPNLLQMRDAVNCNANVLTDIKEVGKGELHSSDEEGNLLRDKKEKELKGKELADEATSQFDSSKDKDTHLERLTEKENEGLEKAKNSEERAKYLYRLLRRVEIIFKKEGTRTVPTVTRIPEGKKPCPPEVLKEAREKLPDKIL